ncbi:MAG: hypothetical protein L0Y72_10160 [Gemmataceae bacterium]|nr:hypothetical protein [Gemmataceae bacterium]MCI0739397.1 hypothetical protein [Gemmataceae bacterium]
MNKSLQVVLSLLVPSVLLISPVRAGEEAKSPEDVFKAFASAMKQVDVKTAMSHLTRDSQTWITGMTLLWAAVSKEFSANDEKNGKARIAAIEHVLKRHGVSYDAAVYDAAAWEILVDRKNSSEKLVALTKTVKYKPALAADFLKIVTRLEGPSVFKAIGGAKLKDVTIDTETAKGQVTKGKDSTTSALSIFEIAFPSAIEECDTLYFALQDGVWKIDLIETYRNRPPPPPQVQQPSPQIQTTVTHYDSRPGLLRRLCPWLCR